MNYSIFIKNGAIITVILTVVFLSQQPYFKNTNFNFPLFKKGNSYLTKANDWLKTNIYSKISGGVADKKETVKNEVNKQKNNIEKNSWQEVKKYMAERTLRILGVQPQELASPQQSQQLQQLPQSKCQK